jgi:hypothetical protein
MPNRLLTQEEANARLHAQGLELPPTAVPDTVRAACDHCWHLPRDWQQGSLTGPAPRPRLCCWCGAREEPQHGPYAPKG